jgi:hypothetical protein
VPSNRPGAAVRIDHLDAKVLLVIPGLLIVFVRLLG